MLLLSTDPAHSLADVFDAPVGDRAAAVSRRAAEPASCASWTRRAALAARRAELEAALDEIAGGARRADASARSAQRRPSELMDLAPPGIDELFGILSVVERARRATT